MLTFDTSTAATASKPETCKANAPVSLPTPSADESAKLGWILTHKKWISPAQLEASLTAQQLQSQKLGELLVAQALISDEQLRQALQEQYWRRNGYWVI